VVNIQFYSNDIRLDFNVFKRTKFWENNLQSLNLFRLFTQFIDIISLDVEYLFYFERILCLAVNYLIILKYFNIIDFTQIVRLKMSHICDYHEFNLLFDSFLNRYYSLEFTNIFDHIRYSSCNMQSALHFEEIIIDNIVWIKNMLYKLISNFVISFRYLIRKRNLL